MAYLVKPSLFDIVLISEEKYNDLIIEYLSKEHVIEKSNSVLNIRANYDDYITNEFGKFPIVAIGELILSKQIRKLLNLGKEIRCERVYKLCETRYIPISKDIQDMIFNNGRYDNYIPANMIENVKEVPSCELEIKFNILLENVPDNVKETIKNMFKSALENFFEGAFDCLIDTTSDSKFNFDISKVEIKEL